MLVKSSRNEVFLIDALSGLNLDHLGACSIKRYHHARRAEDYRLLYRAWSEGGPFDTQIMAGFVGWHFPIRFVFLNALSALLSKAPRSTGASALSAQISKTMPPKTPISCCPSFTTCASFFKKRTSFSSLKGLPSSTWKKPSCPKYQRRFGPTGPLPNR